MAASFPVLRPWSEIPKYLLVPELRACICLFDSFQGKQPGFAREGGILHSCIALSIKPVSLILNKMTEKKAVGILLQVKCCLKGKEGMTVADS